MNAFRGVPAKAGAGDFVRLIFARPLVGAGAIGLPDIVGLRRILGDVVARILALVGSDRVQLVRLLGVDLLGQALCPAAGQQSQCEGSRGGQADSHFIPPVHGRYHNAPRALWGAA